jgi:hypothetical protein
MRIRNRMHDEYNALALTVGNKDCYVKVRLSFELENDSGAVSFKEIPAAKSDVKSFASRDRVSLWALL